MYLRICRLRPSRKVISKVRTLRRSTSQGRVLAVRSLSYWGGWVGGSWEDGGDEGGSNELL